MVLLWCPQNIRSVRARTPKYNGFSKGNPVEIIARSEVLPKCNGFSEGPPNKKLFLVRGAENVMLLVGCTKL